MKRVPKASQHPHKNLGAYLHPPKASAPKAATVKPRKPRDVSSYGKAY